MEGSWDLPFTQIRVTVIDAKVEVHPPLFERDVAMKSLQDGDLCSLLMKCSSQRPDRGIPVEQLVRCFQIRLVEVDEKYDMQKRHRL